MGRSLGFGSHDGDWVALFRLAFAAAVRRCYRFAWPPPCTRRIILQKARHQADQVMPGHGPLTVGGDMISGSLSFPLSGCFSPFPHGTHFTIGRKGYVALEGGPPSFPQDFAGPVVLRQPAVGGWA
jgi:hypothetical protein